MNDMHNQIIDNIRLLSSIFNKKIPGWQDNPVVYIVIGVIIVIIATGICSVCSKKKKFRYDRCVKMENIKFSIKNINYDLAKICRFGYLLVRFGTDEFLERTATDIEEMDAILQNKDIYAKSNYDKINNEINIHIPLRIHKTLGIQFKLFVDVTDINRVNDIKSLLEENGQFDNVKVSSSLNKNRIYFLLRGLSETQTPEGIRNNFIYPR